MLQGNPLLLKAKPNLMDIKLQMVLEVFPHTRDICHNRDSKFFEIISISNTRKHEKLWRVDCSTAQNHFLGCPYSPDHVVLMILHTYCSVVFKEDSSNHCFCFCFEVFSVQCRSQVSISSVPSLPLVYCHVHPAKAFLLVAVHVVCEGVTCLNSCINERLVQRILGLATGHVEWAVSTTVIIRT